MRCSKWKQILIVLRSIKITAIHSVAWKEKFGLFGNWINQWNLQGSYPTLWQQLWYVSTYKHNIKARSCNHCCCGKAISIIYFERVCNLSYPVRNIHALYYIVTCGSSGSKIFFHITSQAHKFRKTLLNIKCVFWCPVQLLSVTFFILQKNSARILWSGVTAPKDESAIYIRVNL